MAATQTNGAGAKQDVSSGSLDVQTLERMLPPIVGAALIIQGIKRQSVGGAVLTVAGGGLIYRTVTTNPPVRLALGLGASNGQGQEESAGAPATAPELERAITIGKPADELYALWRKPETLPQLLSEIAEVVPDGPDRARWTFQAPLGRSLTWETRVVEDRPGDYIAWESVEGSQLPSTGSVAFRPAPPGWGTEVHLRFRFEPPGGIVGEAVMKFAQSAPNMMAGKVLRRFKSLAETGEIPRTAPQPAARDDKS